MSRWSNFRAVIAPANIFMKRMIRLITPLFGAAALIAWHASAVQPGSTNAAAPAKPTAMPANLFPDTVIAKGKGVEVKRSQLDEKVIRLKSQAAGRGQPVPPERSAEVEQMVLAQLIQNQLLMAKVTDADKAAGKALAEKRLADAKTRLGSEEAIDRQLKLIGSTREEWMTDMAEAGAAETLIKREIKTNVTDEDVKKYYDENPAKFEQPEMVRASHILLATQDQKTREEFSSEKKAAQYKLAEDLLKRARAGEDFAKLAKEYSEDPGSKDKGGEYTFARNQMVKEFEAAAFALNTNQVSDIVTTQFGYHIIKLSEKIPAKKVELAKVAAELKDGLTQQALQKQLPDFFDKLKKEAGVEILDERLKPRETAAALAVPAAPPLSETRCQIGSPRSLRLTVLPLDQYFLLNFLRCSSSAAAGPGPGSVLLDAAV